MIGILSRIFGVIPPGPYCYENEICPYWDRIKDREYQEDGYCHLLKKGDWDENIFLLWDKCKECGLNDDDEYYEKWMPENRRKDNATL